MIGKKIVAKGEGDWEGRERKIGEREKDRLRINSVLLDDLVLHDFYL